MNNCVCGKAVRLGGRRVRIDRKNGVFHYIVHMDDSAPCIPGQWETLMLKPYPKRNEEKGWFQMIARWNSLAALKSGHAAPTTPEPNNQTAVVQQAGTREEG